MNIKHECEFKDCNSLEVEEYFNQWDDLTPDGEWQSEWLCADHAVEYGFCLGCHYFCAGMESYDFSPVKGLCGECVSDLRSETGEDIENDEYDGWDYYPADWYDASSPVSELEPDETPRYKYIGEGSEQEYGNHDE